CSAVPVLPSVGAKVTRSIRTLMKGRWVVLASAKPPSGLLYWIQLAQVRVISKNFGASTSSRPFGSWRRNSHAPKTILSELDTPAPVALTVIVTVVGVWLRTSAMAGMLLPVRLVMRMPSATPAVDGKCSTASPALVGEAVFREMMVV